MTYHDAPPSVRSLEQRLRNLEGNDALPMRPAQGGLRSVATSRLRLRLDAREP